MNAFARYVKRVYALSDKGIENMYKGMFWTVVVNLIGLASISLLYVLMQDFVAMLTAGSDPAPVPSLLVWLGVMAAFCAVSFGCHFMQYHYTYSVVYEEVGTMRVTLAERLRKLPLSFFAHRDLAELTETMMADVNRMEHVWSHVLAYLYGSYVSTALAAVGLICMDWKLGLACLWGVPVAFGLLFGSRALSVPRSQRMKAAALAVSDNVQELAEDAREIRATNQERRYLDALGKRIDHAEALATETELVNGLFVNGASVIMRLGMATTVLVGAQDVLAGRIDFMHLFMYLLVITRIYAPFDQALALISEVFLSATSVTRLQEITEAPLADGAEEFAPRGYDIRFDHVGFGYGNEAVLEDVSFVAREGEVTALVGPSGSGKSTCARLAARLWDHDAGSLTVGGVEVLDVDPETLMSAFSMVFQDVVLFDDTVMENIRLGRRGATDEEVLAAAAAANCDEFVGLLPQGYATEIGENGARLSGGERQRISIARALLKDAPIVLLDEATASLDVENETRVQGALSKLLAGRTVLVIAHRMRTVMGADKVVVLDGGRVAEQGSPQELLAAGGEFARMVALQTESAGWSL